jgi:hypothetical protein
MPLDGTTKDENGVIPPLKGVQGDVSRTACTAPPIGTSPEALRPLPPSKGDFRRRGSNG